MYHDELKKGNARTKYFFFVFIQSQFWTPKKLHVHILYTCTHTLYLENKLKNASQFLFIIYSQIIHWKTRMLDNLHKWHWTFYALLPLPWNFSTDMFYTSWWWNEPSFSSKDLKKYFFSVLECNKHAYITWYIDLWP